MVKRNKGIIVNVSSSIAYLNSKMFAAYVAAKVRKFFDSRLLLMNINLRFSCFLDRLYPKFFDRRLL